MAIGKDSSILKCLIRELSQWNGQNPESRSCRTLQKRDTGLDLRPQKTGIAMVATANLRLVIETSKNGDLTAINFPLRAM